MRKLLLLGLIVIAAACSSIAPEPEQFVASPITAAAPSQLLAMEYRSMQQAQLSLIDASTDERKALWEMPPGTWLHQMASINETTVGLSYSPLALDGGEPYKQAGVYALSLTGENPQPVAVIPAEQPGQFHYSPIWTTDGRYIFYVRYILGEDVPDVTLMRFETETKEKIEIAKDAIWPRVSPDNQLVTWINVEPESQKRGLVVSDLGGVDQRQLVEIGEYADLDTPLFSAESQQIYFTASRANRKVTFLDWLFGVRVASAHTDANIPAEWHRIPISGGEPEQLSKENKRIIYGDFDASGTTLYFSTLDGFYSMPQTGGAFTQISATPNIRTFIATVAEQK